MLLEKNTKNIRNEGSEKWESVLVTSIVWTLLKIENRSSIENRPLR